LSIGSDQGAEECDGPGLMSAFDPLRTLAQVCCPPAADVRAGCKLTDQGTRRSTARLCHAAGLLRRWTVATTKTRAVGKSKAGATRAAKPAVQKTQARTIGKKAGELLKEPLVREGLTAVVVTAMARRSARKAAREEIRESVPATAGAAFGSALGSMAGEALRGLVSKPKPKTAKGSSTTSRAAGADTGSRKSPGSTSATRTSSETGSKGKAGKGTGTAASKPTRSRSRANTKATAKNN
jgi:hypothetical protein